MGEKGRGSWQLAGAFFSRVPAYAHDLSKVPALQACAKLQPGNNAATWSYTPSFATSRLANGGLAHFKTH